MKIKPWVFHIIPLPPLQTVWLPATVFLLFGKGEKEKRGFALQGESLRMNPS